MRGTVPWPSRSSGTKAAPSRRRAVIESRRRIGRRSIDVGIARRERFAGQRREQLVLAVAGDAGDAEDLAAAHLERDAVEPHAVRIVRRAAEIAHDRAAACRARCAVGASPRRYRRRPSCGRAMPRFPRADRRSRPPCRARRMVAVSQSAPHLLELVADVEEARPSPCEPLQRTTKSWSASCGVSTAVGSSRIRSFGSCSRQRTISMRWRSPTESRHTSRLGSSGRP